MGVAMKLPDDHPIIIAWNEFKSTEEFKELRQEWPLESNTWVAFDHGFRKGSRNAYLKGGRDYFLYGLLLGILLTSIVLFL